MDGLTIHNVTKLTLQKLRPLPNTNCNVRTLIIHSKNGKLFSVDLFSDDSDLLNWDDVK